MANFKIHFQWLHALYTKKMRDSPARAKSSRENEDSTVLSAQNLEIRFSDETREELGTEHQTCSHRCPGVGGGGCIYIYGLRSEADENFQQTSCWKCLKALSHTDCPPLNSYGDR